MVMEMYRSRLLTARVVARQHIAAFLFHGRHRWNQRWQRSRQLVDYQVTSNVCLYLGNVAREVLSHHSTRKLCYHHKDDRAMHPIHESLGHPPTPRGTLGNFAETRGGVGKTLLSLTLVRLCEESQSRTSVKLNRVFRTPPLVSAEFPHVPWE